MIRWLIRLPFGYLFQSLLNCEGIRGCLHVDIQWRQQFCSQHVLYLTSQRPNARHAGGPCEHWRFCWSACEIQEHDFLVFLRLFRKAHLVSLFCFLSARACVCAWMRLRPSFICISELSATAVPHWAMESLSIRFQEAAEGNASAVWANFYSKKWLYKTFECCW